MLTFLLVTCLIISLGLNVATFKLIQILLAKTGIYEQWILELKNDVTATVETMRKIDGEATFKSSFEATDKGTFESDDQVGQVFKDLVKIVEKLNERIQ